MKKLTSIKQKSFTLIELIAVLLILGILAAVAVPKYLDLVTDSEVKACEGAVASLNGFENMKWSENKLKASGLTDAAIYALVVDQLAISGDFAETTVVDGAGTVTYGSTGNGVNVTRYPGISGAPGYWIIDSSLYAAP